MSWEGELEQNPIDSFILVEFLDFGRNLRRCRRGGEMLAKRGDSHSFTGSFLVADIGGTGGVISDADNGQSGGTVALGENRLDLRSQSRLHRLCESFTV